MLRVPLLNVDEIDECRCFVYDEDVPHAVASRHKLAAHMCQHYGAEASLFNVEGFPPHIEWIVEVRLSDADLVIQLPASQAEDYPAGLYAAYTLLELITRRGFPFSYVLGTQQATCDSGPIEGPLASRLLDR